jgi:SAM-dependent methyltransferase
MLARRALPSTYLRWNEAHAAPFGRSLPSWQRRFLPWRIQLARMGPFAVQPNSGTRVYEYPWAFFAARVERGQRALEIGGGLSGFQFVLAASGCSVTNVDPGLDARGVAWRCDPAGIERMNRIFGTAVELRNTVVGDAALMPASYDRAFAISVLEHLPADERADVMRHVFTALRPGGYFIVTVDLFLNCAPFCSRTSNRYGSNVDVRELAALAPFEVVEGDPKELLGFEEFAPDAILSRLDEFCLGEYPALAQCMLLRKPHAT